MISQQNFSRGSKIPDRCLEIPDRCLEIPDRSPEIPDRCLEIPDRSPEIPDISSKIPDRVCVILIMNIRFSKDITWNAKVKYSFFR